MTSVASPQHYIVKGKKQSLYSFFHGLPRLVMVTIHPNKGMEECRLTKLGKWSDHLRKMSDNFLIVREKTGGFHFHGLMSLKPGAKLKYLKNIHTRYDEVNNSSGNFIPKTFVDDVESAIYILEKNEIDPRQCRDLLDTMIELNTIKRKSQSREISAFCRDRKMGHVTRIVNYILKDKPTNVYEDYILIRGGAIHEITARRPQLAAKSP